MKKVLLIDDDEINNELNQIILQKFGYAEEAVVCENGQVALDYLSSITPDALPEVIFLDLRMPVMDGFQFLEAAQKMSEDLTKKIPIYILTSSKNQQDMDKAKSFQVAGYITKPLTTRQLDSLSTQL